MTSGNYLKSRFWERVENRVRCLVCERRCTLPDGCVGACGNYKNLGGELYNIGYGRLSVIESRPIEIKPLFHYWPGSTALTYSNYGCNFYCPWCQNDHLSYSKPRDETHFISPEKLVGMALINGDDGLSASFNEPTTQLDFVIDVSELAVKHGLYSMVVTNMYFTEQALKALIESGVDGFSADIKGCPQMKRALVGIDHTVVFRNAKKALDLGAHVEMVYLVVTNTNDFEECYEWIIRKHLDYLGPDIPLHINRYFPAHRWREPPTPISKLLEIRDYAVDQGIKYVYVGNLWTPEFESTKCPRCGRTLILRSGYKVLRFDLVREGEAYKCRRCGEAIPIRGRYISK